MVLLKNSNSFFNDILQRQTKFLTGYTYLGASIMVSGTIAFLFIYQSRYSNVQHAPFCFLFPSELIENKVDSYTQHKPSNNIGISIIFSLICNPSSSRTNFFAFSMAF